MTPLSQTKRNALGSSRLAASRHACFGAFASPSRVAGAGEWAPMGTSPPSLPIPDRPNALESGPRTRKPARRAGFPERARQDSNLRLLPPENSRRNAPRNAQTALQSQIPAHRERTGRRATRPDSAQFGGVWAPVPKRLGSGRAAYGGLGCLKRSGADGGSTRPDFGRYAGELVSGLRLGAEQVAGSI
jgi:hypothetical protein